MSGDDMRLRCWCGRFLRGDTVNELWICEGCNQVEDNCECDYE